MNFNSHLPLFFGGFFLLIFVDLILIWNIVKMLAGFFFFR